jgi:hypothetical protein
MLFWKPMPLITFILSGMEKKQDADAVTISLIVSEYVYNALVNLAAKLSRQ